MAAVVVTSSASSVFGNARVAMYVVTTVANNDSLITTLNSIDVVQLTEAQAASTANSLCLSTVSGGTINFTVAGTVVGAHILVIGR